MKQELFRIRSYGHIQFFIQISLGLYLNKFGKRVSITDFSAEECCFDSYTEADDTIFEHYYGKMFWVRNSISTYRLGNGYLNPKGFNSVYFSSEEEAFAALKNFVEEEEEKMVKTGDFSVEVLSPVISEELQKSLFEKGYAWMDGSTHVQNTDEPYLCVRDSILYYAIQLHSNYKELSIKEVMNLPNLKSASNTNLETQVNECIALAKENYVHH